MKGVLSIKIEESMIKKIKDFCKTHGLKQGFFVEKALREQIGREEMIENMIDLKKLRLEEKSAIDFDKYLKKRKA